MKNTIILILVFFAFIFSSCNSKNREKTLDSQSKKNVQTNSKDILGSWNWRSEDKSQEFTIKIKRIDKDSVFGQYCAVYNNGNKIDCDVDDINNIKGLIVKDKIKLKFDSFFGGKNGKAEIKIFENYIEWKVTKSPNGEYYSPESAILYRKSDTSKTVVNNSDSSYKKVQLPFDFQKYMELCYLKENKICDDKFPFYKSDELSSITHLINNNINKNIPDRIYCIQNTGLDFETYIFQIKDESQDYLLTYILITVKDNKIIANQLIGQSIDGEAPEDVDVIDQTFVIDKDLTISVFDKIYKKKNKLSIKYVVNSDGKVQTI